MADGVIKLTEGVIGSGKTCCCVRMLVDDFLVNKDGLFISNIPIYPEKVADYVHRKHGKDRQQTLDRLIFIPEDEQDAWRKGVGGQDRVKEYLTSHDLKDAWVLLDEAQYYFGDDKSGEWINEVKCFFSVIRHYYAMIDLVTQADMMIALEVRQLASQGRVIIPNEGRRLPYFNIRFSDIYELWAKCGGRYEAVSAIQERLKVGKRWINQGSPQLYYRSPEIFELYNSHGAAGGAASNHAIFEYQKRSWPSLLGWFWRRNWWNLSKVGVVLGIFFWFTILGGMNFIMTHGMSFMMKGMNGMFTGKKMEKTGVLAEAKKEEQTEEKTPLEMAKIDSVFDDKEMVRRLEVVIKTYEEKDTRMRRENMEASKELGKATAENEDLRQRMRKDSGLVAIMPECVVFRSGERVGIGEGVTYGDYKGWILDRTDLRKREAHFLGSRVLFMHGGDGMPEGKPAGREGVKPPDV